MNLFVDGIIFQRQRRGGISRLFYDLLPRLCELDDQLHVYLITSGKLKQPLPQHPHIHPIPMLPVTDLLRPKRYLMRQSASLKRYLLGRKLQSDQNSIWFSTSYTLPPQNWPGRSVVLVFDFIPEKFGEFFPGRVNQALQKEKETALHTADLCICISQTTKDDLIDLYHIPPELAHVVYLAYDPEHFQPSDTLDHKRNKPFILYIGTRNRYKNFQFLLDCYIDWPERARIDLVAVGSEWTQEEQAFIAENQLESQVHLMRNISDSELNQLYNQAEAFVHPSHYEGFGIPLLEAMAAGCPIVASDIPTSQEVASKHAYFFDLHDAISFYQALDMAIVNGRRHTRVSDGIQFAQEFSWEKTTQEIYRCLCKAANKAS